MTLICKLHNSLPILRNNLQFCCCQKVSNLRWDSLLEILPVMNWTNCSVTVQVHLHAFPCSTCEGIVRKISTELFNESSHCDKLIIWQFFFFMTFTSLSPCYQPWSSLVRFPNPHFQVSWRIWLGLTQSQLFQTKTTTIQKGNCVGILLQYIPSPNQKNYQS